MGESADLGLWLCGRGVRTECCATRKHQYRTTTRPIMILGFSMARDAFQRMVPLICVSFLFALQVVKLAFLGCRDPVVTH